MPARDGTGPYGSGPVGRGLGPCGENGQEPVNDQSFGMGMAHRRGQRFWKRQPRWGWRAYPPEEEMRVLQNQQNWLKE
jgi:hypothetical protein